MAASEYVDIEALERKLKRYKDKMDKNPDFFQDGIDAGDTFILQYFDPDKLPAPTPPELVRAAVLWAAKDIIIALETGNTEDSAAVKEYKEEAQSIIEKYLEDHPEDEPESERAKIGFYTVSGRH